MTRETKIGLLVGLAFIVVFAMLLSHSGPTAPPGDLRQLADARQNPPPSSLHAPEAEPHVLPIASNREALDPPMVREGSSGPTVIDPPSPTDSDLPDALPNPQILNPSEPPGTESVPVEIAEAHPRGTLESIVRSRPTELIRPEPSIRDFLPASTPRPGGAAGARAEGDERTTRTTDDRRVVSTSPARRDREHVVQKGETVHSILSREYGSSSSKIMDMFQAANRDIKNVHMVIEGQKVMLPPLPPEVSEPAGGKLVVDAARQRDPDLTRVGAPIAETNRKAPGPAAKIADKTREKDLDPAKKDTEKPATPARGPARETRVYEVRSKDTFSSIARDHLGSETLWKEIQRLNPKVDPARLKPGTRLQLPSKRPLTDLGAAGRT